MGMKGTIEDRLPAAARSARDSSWTELVDRLIDSEALIVRRTTALFAQRLESYRSLAQSDFSSLMEDTLHNQLLALRAGVIPKRDAENAAYEELGAVRARQGISVGDLLQGYRIGSDVVRARAREVAPNDELRDANLLRLLEEWDSWADTGMAASAVGHRQTELASMRRVHERRASFVRQVLSGGIQAAKLNEQLAAYGIAPAEGYYAVRARPTDDANVHAIESYLRVVSVFERPFGIAALIDGDVCGFLTRPPTGAASVPIGIEGPIPLEQLGSAFERASRALDTAEALGRTGPFELSDLGILPAVLGDDHVSEGLMDRYIRPLEKLGASGATILETVGQYIVNDGRLAETARELYVHSNTVRYRIGRFEETTGASLRDYDGLVKVWWALKRYELADGKPG
jgi:hypothetical protein